MSTREAQETQGLRSSLMTLAASLHALARTRLELLSLDLDEGRERLTAMLLAGLGAMLAIGIGTVLAVIALVLVIDASYRLPLLIALAGFCLLAGALGSLWIMQHVQAMPSIFGASLAELDKDRQQLREGR